MKKLFVLGWLVLIAMLAMSACVPAPTPAAPPAAASQPTTAPAVAPTTAAASASSAPSSAAPVPTTAAATTGQPVKGGTLKVGWIPDAVTFDPHFSTQLAERFVLYAIFNNVVQYDSQFNIKPDLAKSWEVSSDNLTVTFHLQEGVKFQDGTDCDATAVKWNLDRVLDAQVNSPQRKNLDPFIKSVDVVDKTTFKINLKQPYSPLFATLADRAGFIVSPTAAQKSGKDFGRNPVGTGPFKFVEWVPDDHLYLQRFDGYWEQGKPYLDRIELRVVPDRTVRLTMVKSGEVDLATDLDPKDLPTLKGNTALQVYPVNPPARWQALQWHLNEPPFNNKSLRQAIAYGIDRQQILDVLWGGNGQVAKGPAAPGLWWYSDSTKGYTHDVAKAKQLMTEAGYANGFSFTFYAENTPDYIRMSQLLQAQLKEIGVTLNVQMVNPADSYSMVLADKINWIHTYWSQRGDPDGLYRLLFYSKGSGNTTHYNNPDVDKLLDQAAATNDLAQRKSLYQQAEQMIIDDAPYVFIAYTQDFAVLSSKVKNWVWIPDLQPRYRELWKEP